MTAYSQRFELDNRERGSIWLRIDVSIVLLSLTLVGLGLVVVYSATRGIVLPGQAPDRSFVNKQVFFVGAGLVLGAVATAVDYRRSKSLIPFAYVGSVVLLLGLPIFGQEWNGAKSWYSLGFATLQPSEFAKLALILTMAAWFSRQRPDDAMGLTTVLLGLAMGGFLAVLVLIQPDYGTVMVYGAIVLGVIFVAGVRPYQFAILTSGLVAGVVLLFSTNRVRQTQLNRFTAFADPDSILRYNVDQAEIAIGSGGLTGKGLFQGTQNNNSLVPEKETDFIFSVVGEELGFIGSAALLVLFGLLLMRIWRVAHLAENEYGRLICVGVFAMFLFQAFQSVGMNMGMMPVTGIPLPLISYGGSSMVTTLIAIGLVENVHAHRLR